jgi:hypothetical protein
VNRSDCHNWFGSARSKRWGEGEGLARGLTRGFDSPSAFNTRRTVVADAPIPKNRRIASRIRRAPASGSARFAAKIASRRAFSGRGIDRATRVGASSAFAPPCRYTRTHSSAVVYATPNRVAASCALTPWSTTARATSTRTSSGHPRRAASPGEEELVPLVRFTCTSSRRTGAR